MKAAPEFLGSTVHYHINEYSPEQLAHDVVFTSQMRVHGGDALKIANLIFEHSGSTHKTEV